MKNPNYAYLHGWDFCSPILLIASNERLTHRPIIQDMLETALDGSYDSVLVMDIDRLGRGNNKNWGVRQPA